MGRSTAFVDPPVQLTARQRLQERIAAQDRAGLHSEWIVHVRACKIKSCSDSCTRQKRSLAHVKKCRQSTCDYDGMCQITKEVLDHYKKCDKPKETCKICCHLLKTKPPAAVPVVQQPQQPQAVQPVQSDPPQQPPEASSSGAESAIKKKKKKKSPAGAPSTSAGLVEIDYSQYVNYDLREETKQVGWMIPSSKGAVCPPTPPDSPVGSPPRPNTSAFEAGKMLGAKMFEALFHSTLATAAAMPQASPAIRMLAETTLTSSSLHPHPALRDLMTPAVVAAAATPEMRDFAAAIANGTPTAEAFAQYAATVQPETLVPQPSVSAIIEATSPFCEPTSFPYGPHASLSDLLVPQDAPLSQSPSSSSSSSSASESLLMPGYSTAWMPEEQRAKFRLMQQEARDDPNTPWIGAADRERFLLMDFGEPPAAAAAEAAGHSAFDVSLDDYAAAPQRPLPSSSGRMKINARDAAAAGYAAGAAEAKAAAEAAGAACGVVDADTAFPSLDMLQLHASTIVHARDCDPNSGCTLALCKKMKFVFTHIGSCFEREDCKFDRCASTRKILRHWTNCALPKDKCTLCEQRRKRGKSAEHYISIDPQLLGEVCQYSLSAQLMEICLYSGDDAVKADPVAEDLKSYKMVDDFILRQKLASEKPSSSNSSDDHSSKVVNMIRALSSLTEEETSEMKRLLAGRTDEEVAQEMMRRGGPEFVKSFAKTTKAYAALTK